MEAALGQAGHAITGSGGGGNGRYVFTNLEELDAIITEWVALRDRIHARGAKLQQAIGLIEPPAEDVMSRLQANAGVQSLKKAEEHRLAMELYATQYIERLLLARAQYATTETDNATVLRKLGEG